MTHTKMLDLQPQIQPKSLKKADDNYMIRKYTEFSLKNKPNGLSEKSRYASQILSTNTKRKEHTHQKRQNFYFRNCIILMFRIFISSGKF